MGLFGTDGVRGTANTWPMTPDMALKLGQAAGRHFRREGGRVVIGKDTRLSGYMIENALTAGLTSMGVNVLLLGPVPTPAVGYLTRSMRADVGIMISASHNPARDNGIKFFGPDGYKLSGADEARIEELAGGDLALARPSRIGRAQRIEEAHGRYAEYVKTTLPPSAGGLQGLKVVIDAANGAAYKVAPEVLWELGAEVISVGVGPDGHNINDGCGSTAPMAAAMMVREKEADVGLCLDGDADRIILIDETGAVGDGDQIMALLASRLAAEGRLAKDTLVATVMSNLGLERFLEGRGLALHRTAVGDRHVVEAMRREGYSLGGEQSGHIVLGDHATTGDGLMAGLRFLAEMVRSGAAASTLLRQFETVPQRLVNVTYARGSTPLEAKAVKAAIAEAEAMLQGQGRLLIRASGTEPKIRVMAEAEDEAVLGAAVEGVAEAVRAAV